MKQATALAWALAWAVLAAGCGGGGGGGTGNPSGGTGADDATYLVISPPSATVYDSRWLVARTANFGGGVLGLGQWAVDVAQRFTHPGVPAALTVRCLTGGAVAAGAATFTLEDRDASGGISVGDSIVAVMQRCGAPVTSNMLTGTLRIEVLAGTSAALDRAVLLRVSTPGGLQLGYEEVGVSRPTTFTGAFNVAWSEDETTQSLAVTTTAAEELQFLNGNGPNNVIPDRLRQVALWRRADFASAEINTSMSLINEVNDGGGRVVLSTIAPARSTLAGRMMGGVFRIQGREGYIQIEPSGTSGLPFIVRNNLGDAVRSGNVDAGTADIQMRWHGHGLIEQTRFMPQELAAWIEMDPAAVNCSLIGLCGGQETQDFVFMHPVLPQPGVASAQARFRLQLGEALAPTQPDLRFEFRDCLYGDTSGQTWDIPATVQRRGAFFALQPQESLRHGHHYSLRVTRPDDPLATVLLTMADGSTRPVRSQGPCVLTPSTLLLDLSSDAPSLVGADDSTTLRALVTADQGQAVASYHWQQISGSALRLGTPDAANTAVAYADAASRPVGDALVQLTVTDVRGNVQRERIALRVGDTVSSTTWAYSERTLSDGRRIRDLRPAPGPEASLWPPGTDRGWMGTSYIESGNGAALAVGRYDGAQAVGTPGSQPRLGDALNLNDCLGTLSAWFEILEFDRDSATGAPSRLAMDYAFTCDRPRLPEMPARAMGSYRFNSGLPPRH
jgi:hypothetical protein